MIAQTALLLFTIFFSLMAFKVPVSFSIMLASLGAIVSVLNFDFGMFISAQRIVTGMDSFSLIAVPFFVLAGLLMSNGGIAQRLVDLALAMVGKVPGSLAHANIVGNALFGSISGSGVAAAAAIGGVMIPMEKEEGYDPAFAAAVNIATAPTGQLIPPTSAFIIYSLASGGTSVATLFIAGWIPGLLWAAICMVAAFIIAKKHGYVVKGAEFKLKTVFTAFMRALPSLFIIVLIIGGILQGIFTPTEAAGVAVVYCLILSMVVYRTIKVSDLKKILVETVSMTAIIMLIIGASSILSFVMSFTGIPQALSHAVLSISDNPIILLLIMNVLLLFIGIFMDMAPSLLIFTPILLPIAQSCGMSPIQFGVMIVMNLAIGTITPPIGSVLFVGCSIAEMDLEDVVKSLMPFYGAIIIALLMITFIPSLSEGLPRLFGLM